jgi:hypothetical protein
MGALADPRAWTYALKPLLRDLGNSQLRSLALDFDGDQTEARARRLGEALPPSLVDVRFKFFNPALLAGLAKSKLARDGRLLRLELPGCEAVGARLQPLLAALARGSGGQLQTLDLWCARATARPARGA